MPTFNKPTQEKLQKNAVKFAAAVYKAQAGNQAEAEVAKAKLKQEAILNKATNQWGYGRGPILSIFHGLNTAKKLNAESALTSLRSSIGSPEKIVVEKRSTISAGLYAIQLQFEKTVTLSIDELNAINASLQASFLAKLEGEHKFSLSIDNNSTTYTKTPANKATVNNFSIYINDAIHSNKWSEVSFKNAINAALETLKEFEFIDFNKKIKIEREIFGKPSQEKLKKNAEKFDKAQISGDRVEQERLLNKATNQWGYGRGPVLGIFHGLNTAQKFNTELALTSLRSAIGNPENIVVEKRSTISAGLYAIELQFENPASISRDELIAINASLQANFLAKLEGEHKFSLSINNNSNTYKETSSNELLVNNISIHINEAVHSNKWSEVSFDEAINAALKTLEELKLINDAAKNKVENEIYGEQPQASFQLS